MTMGTVTTTARTSAKVINLSPATAGERIVRPQPAEVVNLQPALQAGRAEARDRRARRAKLWERAWIEYQAYQKLNAFISDLCALKRRDGGGTDLFKGFGHLIRQPGAPHFQAERDCLVRLLLTPAPNAAAVAWKRANADRRHMSKGETKSVVAMIEADQVYVESAARRRRRAKRAH